MSRQLEQEAEERESARKLALIKAVEFGLVRALQNQGAELKGFAIRYGEFSSLMTLRAEFNGVRFVSYGGPDSIKNCLIKADADAAINLLKWQRDKYHNDQP